MAAVTWEGDNLTQEPSWEKQLLKINLLGWKLGAARGWHRDEDWATAVSGAGHRNQDAAPLGGSALPPSPPWALQGWEVDLIHWQELFLQHMSSNCSHSIWLWTGPCLLWGLWSVFNETRKKKIYSKCRTMNGTSAMAPEVTYTVFCYIYHGKEKKSLYHSRCPYSLNVFHQYLF